MAILLPEIRAAVAAAVNSVTCSVSVPVADTPAAISPTEEFTFSVTASNTAANSIRLINVRYHVTSPGTRAELKVPAATLPARATNDPTAPLLVPNKFVHTMVLFPLDNSLDVGDSDTISGLKGKAVLLGPTNICCHVYADPDLNHLFQKGIASSESCRIINIV